MLGHQIPKCLSAQAMAMTSTGLHGQELAWLMFKEEKAHLTRPRTSISAPEQGAATLTSLSYQCPPI